MTVITMPPIASEHQEQAALIEWWAWRCKSYGIPEFALFAIPNGGVRHKAVAGKLKAEGVRPGVPDLLLAVPIPPDAGLFIEMKARNHNARLSADQKVSLLYLNGAGYATVCCFGADQATEAINNYLRAFQPKAMMSQAPCWLSATTTG